MSWVFDTSYQSKLQLRGKWRNEIEEIIHTVPEEFKTQQSPVTLDLCLEKNWVGKSRDYRKATPPAKPAFSNSVFGGFAVFATD